MNRTFLSLSRLSGWVPALLVGLLILVPAPSRAQYIGLEPERIVSLLNLPAEEAVSLYKQGRLSAAIEEVGSGGGSDTLRLRYARILLKLHAEPELHFSELRAELADLLRADPFFRDAFDVWLGLNPKKKELQNHLKTLESYHEPAAQWQRAEIWLRLRKPKRALASLRDINDANTAIRNRANRAFARAYFQTERDAAGQPVYERLLDRLDEATANLLFQDVAPIASVEERAQFAALFADEKADFFRQFWARRDPIPHDENNPRLAEHYRRLARALAEYPLQSNGRGFFTDPGVFLSFSPKLEYFDSTVVFEDGEASRYWLDPRGLMLIRHGKPALSTPPRDYGGGEISESWLVRRFQSRPLLFHFVRRQRVGEWTLVLNLGVAAARRPAVPDDPTEVLEELGGSFRRLYASRFQLHSLYSQIAQVRSEAELESLLRSESELMAAYLQGALGFDSTSYYTKDNTLPMTVSISNYHSGGRPAVQLNLGTDLSKLDVDKLGPEPSLDATVTFYNEDWTTERRRVHKTFPLQPPPSGKFQGFIGGIQIPDLDPEDYRIAVDLYQPDSGRVGRARGGHEVGYVHPGSLGISDLFLLHQPAAPLGEHTLGVGTAGQRIPVPGRVIPNSTPFHVEFELYNLEPDESGNLRYEVEERILTLYKKPGFLQQLAGYGNFAGQLFFPVYTFAANVGGFTLSQALASETAGLEITKRLVERSAGEARRDEVQMDLRDLKPGVYTVYVTVRDLNTSEITSRFLTIQVD